MAQATDDERESSGESSFDLNDFPPLQKRSRLTKAVKDSMQQWQLDLRKQLLKAR